MLDSLLHADAATAPTPLSVLLLALLLAFALGQALAWVYMATHDGLSYSRAFVVSLLLLPVIVALVMFVLSNSLVTAFGLMAIFAIVRFRNILRDTLDTAHVLAGIVLGMSCGTLKFTTAIVGGAVLLAIMGYARLTLFGRRLRHDFVLHLEADQPAESLAALPGLLARHGTRVHCVSRRTAPGRGTQLSYHLLLRDPDRVDELLAEVTAVPGITQAAGVPAEPESEV
ncbi:MAG: DUF4956 domain-containing protein [Verrucomicrobia bacterium]|nr:DUF4956 domain-containing protein [Verrucomicrobiota bacterium]